MVLTISVYERRDDVSGIMFDSGTIDSSLLLPENHYIDGFDI
jgi:hypothetical protein